MTVTARSLIKAIVPVSIRSFWFARMAKHITRAHDSVYDQDYYDIDVEEPAVQSAPVMAKSIVQCFKPKTVIDVGCGTGALLEAFRNLNCRVYGLEYSEAGLAFCRRRKLPVRKFYIGKDHIGTERYDAAVSFKVAEHLSPWLADKYVDLLCKLLSIVVMSAATPGQGGTDHVSEQLNSYWIRKFNERGYFFNKKNTHLLSTDWRLAGTIYHKNVMTFVEVGN